MPDITKVLIRNAREQDIPAVAEIDAEAFVANRNVEPPDTFQHRLSAFPEGFVILVAENEIAAYGCTEKWQTEPEPGSHESPLRAHQPDGRILRITGMAVKLKYRKRGYGLMMLDKLIEIAHREGCKKIIVECPQAQGLFIKRGFQTVQRQSESGIARETLLLEIESYGSKA